MDKNKSFLQIIFFWIDRTIKKFLIFFRFNNPFILLFLIKIKVFLKRKINPVTFNQLDIWVAEHCNYSCYSCSRFSHLAEPAFANLSVMEKDLKRLSELSNGNIPFIIFSGGEPLLHPELPEFLRICRMYFPESNIKIITNGLLLLSQKDIFWESLKKYNISVAPTKYPGIDWEKIEEKAAEHGFELDYFDLSKFVKKKSLKFSLDLSGKQNPKKSFNRCTQAVSCITIKNGRIATCGLVFSIHHFNKYFNQKIPVTNIDSIDIYQAKALKEIVNFVNRPIPLCAYCKSMGSQITGDWRKSEKKISEYL